MDFNFDNGFEFNHPKDVFWADGGGDAEEEPNLKEHLGQNDKYDKMYKALDRMMGFLYRCVKETPSGSFLPVFPLRIGKGNTGRKEPDIQQGNAHLRRGGL